MSVRARKPADLADAKIEPSTPSASVADAARSSHDGNDTTAERKEPPPEKPADVRRRTLVVFSFWLITILLGLPIWWQTTQIYRAKLPLDEMLDWADGKVSSDLIQRPLCDSPSPWLTCATAALSTCLPFTDRYRSELCARVRRSASFATHSTCPRRLE